MSINNRHITFGARACVRKQFEWSLLLLVVALTHSHACIQNLKHIVLRLLVFIDYFVKTVLQELIFVFKQVSVSLTTAYHSIEH